ncbi:MAG: DNA-binding protein [Methanobacteriota archaeon]|nr:MAG: DNA-binding protein [Euryarchaeota archaeon]
MEDEEELEELRKKKLEELQIRQQQQMAEEAQAAQIEAQKQSILRQILTPEARERLGRIQLAYPDVAENVSNQLIMLAQSGRVQSVIDDNTLRQILRKILPKKREIKIERR